MKMPKFGTKKTLFESFWVRTLKTIVIFDISTLKFIKNQFLTHAVNFGIRSAFSQSQGLDPSPLYKVCRK